MLNNATGFKHIYIATGYTDLRKSIDGLAMLISTEFKLNPYDEGSIFLFCGKRTDRIKASTWNRENPRNIPRPRRHLPRQVRQKPHRSHG